ncbi:hypothetical protein [Haloferax sulfurifontis]|uniref:Matrixin n=1 Tax=Haloferax sulfurifontis ATCC BAA-897 TaxID=662480 RepID=M0ILJ6_9EURY|nr:hypothetical protein [Haloferax sulfurifontis]ELZ97671.1 hypothetical protein C441_02507 [Haloferax sulfurifontis ATCC BAA-897]
MSLAADRGIVALALAFLVALSGCASLSPSPPVVDAALGTPSADASDGDDGAVSVAVGGTGSSPVPETRPADNPWGRAPVVVGIDAAADGRDYAALVESAVDYWRANASAAAYDPAFVVVPNASEPDVTVSVVERIDACGDYDGADAVGCAPLFDGDEPTAPTEPVSVVVAAGYDDRTTETVLKHEFGHLLGLTHDDAAAFPALSERIETTRLPEPDADERESPFRERTVSVHVDLSNVSPGERATYEAEIDHALSYYESGADGVAPANRSFERVSAPEMADVTLSVSAFRDGGSGVRWRRTGVDVDDDAALEWYTGGDLVVDADLDPSLVDWYVGAGFGYLLAADERADLPPPFRDGDPADDPAWRGVAGERRSTTTPRATTSPAATATANKNENENGTGNVTTPARVPSENARISTAGARVVP